MTFRRRQRWLRRLALGFAFATALFAGKVSAAWAVVDEGGSGTKIVSAGGWSGAVDAETGIPASSGIPQGDEQFLNGEAIKVIPYLSHGTLTEADRAAAAVASAESIHDPYLTDVYVRQGESLGGPDGAQPLSSPDLRGEAFKSQPIVQQAVQQPMNHRQLETLAASYETATRPDDQAVRFSAPQNPPVVSYLSHGMGADGEVGARPDNLANRFSPTDVPVRPGVPVGSSGSDVEWNQVLSVGLGAVVVVLALGLALGYLRRPRLAL